MERLQRLTYPVVLIYLWVMMIMLGAIMLETLMVYPNIFRNAPESLAYASGFFTEASPATFSGRSGCSRGRLGSRQWA